MAEVVHNDERLFLNIKKWLCDDKKYAQYNDSSHVVGIVRKYEYSNGYATAELSINQPGYGGNGSVTLTCNPMEENSLEYCKHKISNLRKCLDEFEAAIEKASKSKTKKEPNEKAKSKY